MRVFNSIESIAAAVDQPLGVTEWTSVTQMDVDAFAALTGDHQWIHVDVDRARTSSFGSTIVHGYLTLALLPMLGQQLYRIEAGSARLNYGVEKVRFPAPLPTGSMLKGAATIRSVTPRPSGYHVRTEWILEADKVESPICVAETITLVTP